MADIVISRDEEQRLRELVSRRKDPEARRMERYLAMPDLSRTPGSPLYEMIERLKRVPSLKKLDIVDIPEIVPASISFDFFDFPPNHPARSKSDTYYADDAHILRTHTTVSWYYYHRAPEIRERLARGETVGALSYGKVYRKDEIDRRHMNVFHQFDGWKIQPDSSGTMPLDELRRVLSDVVTTVFGSAVEYRFLDDDFPYTDPSIQVEVKVGGEWVEILGSGMIKKSVLKKFGVEEYNGWAFGFGLERLAIISMELPDIRLLWSEDERVKKQLVLGKTFVEVSKYPPVVRDISFVVKNNFIPNNYFDMVRDVVGDALVEEVKLIDRYENDEKFGAGNVSYAYRITYRSVERTLTGDEVDALHKKVEETTAKQCRATVR